MVVQEYRLYNTFILLNRLGRLFSEEKLGGEDVRRTLRAKRIQLTIGVNCRTIYGLRRFKMSINLKEDIKPISYIKTNAADMMKYINENHNPIIITQNGEAKGVLMDIESYQEIKDAFALVGIIQLAEDDIKKDQVQSADEVFAELERKYF